MRLLLTGVQGQVGWELERALQPLGEVIALGRHELDLADPAAVREAVLAHRPHWVVNPAAYTAVDQAEDDESLARAVNATGVEAMARACKEIDATLVHYSTDYVFDGEKEGAYGEEDAPNPLGAYGRTKWQGEEAVRRAQCPHVIVRTSWVYSARGRNFLRTILRLAAERNELRIVDDQRGAPTSARFLADATVALVWKASCNPDLARRVVAGETLNICSVGATTWYGFARYIVERAPGPRRPSVVPIASSSYPTKARRPPNSVLSIERLRAVWGIEAPSWQVAADLVLREVADART